MFITLFGSLLLYFTYTIPPYGEVNLSGVALDDEVALGVEAALNNEVGEVALGFVLSEVALRGEVAPGEAVALDGKVARGGEGAFGEEGGGRP